MRSPFLIAAAAIALAACGGEPSRPTTSTTPTPPSPPTSTPATTSGTGAADGASCRVATDCASGVCEGEGCTDDAPGTCVAAARACTKDFRTYCGCDGVTFHGSGSCPGARFAHREACEGAVDGEAAP